MGSFKVERVLYDSIRITLYCFQGPSIWEFRSPKNGSVKGSTRVGIRV